MPTPVPTAAPTLEPTPAPTPAPTPSGVVCGDGYVHVADESCDDGNTAVGDGCDANCGVEAHWNCTHALGGASACAPICGDGVVVAPREACDDGNVVDGDGCSSSCVVETSAPTPAPTPIPTLAPTLAPTLVPTTAPTLPPTPSPTPVLAEAVESSVSLGGYTFETFSAAAKVSFKATLAAALSTSVERIQLTAIRGVAAHRRLSGVLGRRRLGAGIVVDFRVGVTSARAAAAITGAISTVYAAPTLFLSAFRGKLDLAGEAVPEGLQLAEETAPTFNRAPTAAPTPAPPSPAPTTAPTPAFDKKLAVSVSIELTGVTLAAFEEARARLIAKLASMYDVQPSVVLIGSVSRGIRGFNATATDISLNRRRLADTAFLDVTYYVRVGSHEQAKAVAAATTQPRMLVVLMQATRTYAIGLAITAPPGVVRLATTAEELSPTPSPTPAPSRAPTPRVQEVLVPTPLPVVLEGKGAAQTTIIVMSVIGGVIVLAGVAALNRKFRTGVETAKAFSNVGAGAGAAANARATGVNPGFGRPNDFGGSSAGGGFTGRATHVIQTIDGSLIAIDPGTSVALNPPSQLNPHMGPRGQVVPFEALQSLHGKPQLPVAVAMQEPRGAVLGALAKGGGRGHGAGDEAPLGPASLPRVGTTLAKAAEAKAEV